MKKRTLKGTREVRTGEFIQNHHSVKKITLSVALLGLAPLAQAQTVSYYSPLSAEAVGATGTGTATVSLDLDLATMRVDVNFTGLSGNATVAHLHGPTSAPGSGTAGVMTTTPTFAGFPSGVKEGSYDQTFDMTQTSSFRAGFITTNGGTVPGAYNALTVALNDGKAYLNVHSSTFPGGEIRGFPTRSLFTFNRSEASTYADIISGPVALTQSGAGTLTLTGNNTYTGLTTVSAGALLYGAANVISTGAVTVSGTGILNLGASQSDSVGTVTLQGTGQINGTGSSALTSTGTFEMQSGSVSAILAGNAIPLNKTTAGTVTLTGTNTYTGATNVSGGALVVNGSLGDTALTVRTGAQLGGSGTIGSGGGTTVSIESGGSLSPGNSPGMLTINGSLILSEGSTFNYEMFGGGVLADSIDVNGALNLGNASLSLTNLGNYTVNQKFTLFAYETMVGSFAGLANNAVFSGAGGTWKINYNDTSGGVNAGAAGASYVTLTAVSSIPEPRSVLVGGLLLAGLFLRQRRTKGF